jgi:hypothetical protein
MQSASNTASSHQLATTPTIQSAFTSAAAAHDGAHGDGNDTKSSFPKFNLPNSYWLRPSEADPRLERLSQMPGVDERAARLSTESNARSVALLKIVETGREERENNNQAWIRDCILEISNRPFQVPDFSLSAETLAELVGLEDPEDKEPQLQSSTSSTSSSAATAVQQDAAASGCCIPPSCTLL